MVGLPCGASGSGRWNLLAAGTLSYAPWLLAIVLVGLVMRLVPKEVKVALGNGSVLVISSGSVLDIGMSVDSGVWGKLGRMVQVALRCQGARCSKADWRFPELERAVTRRSRGDGRELMDSLSQLGKILRLHELCDPRRPISPVALVDVA